MERTLSVEGSNAPVSKVDAALGAWRTETVTRRAVWDLRAAEDAAEQARRRRSVLRVAAAGGTALGALAGLGLLAVGVALLARPVEATPVAPAAAVELPVLGDGPGPSAVRVERAPTAPTRQTAGPDALGLLGPARSWTSHGGLWVQVDYAGSPMTLRWADARGEPVLEPTPCVNVISDDVRRCYVGRSAGRVKAALKAGAAPGAWTASACRDAVCWEVARFDVR